MIRTALKFMWYDKPKSFGALAGVILSVFLIGQQCGIFIFLTDAMCCLVKRNPDLVWVTDNKTTNVAAMTPLDNRVGRELESIHGVKKVYPFVMAQGSSKFSNGKSAGLMLVGVQAPSFVGGPFLVSEGKKENLIQEGAIFTDYFDRKILGDAQLGEYFEINGKKVFIAGQTKGVRFFGGGAIGFTTVERARFLAKFSKNKSSAFLVEWDTAVGKDRVINNIQKNIVGVTAWDKEKFANSSIITVLKSSGIAFSFGTLIVFAFISGFIIIGLTLYSAAIDRIKDYGTLKAIGATNGYVTRLILMQAFLYALIGFVLGFILVNLFKTGIANAGTLFEYPWWLKCIFFLTTQVIALGGSMFAIKRINSLEPAAIFRG